MLFDQRAAFKLDPGTSSSKDFVRHPTLVLKSRIHGVYHRISFIGRDFATKDLYCAVIDLDCTD
jgi:hypothetical protein